MDLTPSSHPTIEAPRGLFPARVDEKGRLKLPAPVQEYVSLLGETKLFVTTLDLRTVRIYPNSVWKENEKFFADATGDDLEAVERLAFIANDFGADATMDAQGRVLVPQELRRAIGIEDQPVWLDCYKGRINVYSKAEYDQRREQALADAPATAKLLEKKGLR